MGNGNSKDGGHLPEVDGKNVYLIYLRSTIHEQICVRICDVQLLQLFEAENRPLVLYVYGCHLELPVTVTLYGDNNSSLSS